MEALQFLTFLWYQFVVCVGVNTYSVVIGNALCAIPVFCSVLFNKGSVIQIYDLVENFGHTASTFHLVLTVLFSNLFAH